VDRRLNVLVLGVGGNVSQSIQKALALAPTPTRVIGACISPMSAGLYMADQAYVSPLAASPEFIPWLLEVCEQERVDAVLSGSEVVLAALALEALAIRERTGAVCIVSPPEVLETGRDKLKTCQWLELAGLPVPGYADVADGRAVRALVERCGFPLIAKPRLGKGSDYILTIRDEQDLAGVAGTTDVLLQEQHRPNVRGPADLLLQEYLGDEQQEYTAGCFCDRDGQVSGTIVMRRTLNAGTTVTAELGRFPEVREAAQAIVAALRPLGPTNVQLRMHRGRAVPFEINPRFSGTTALRAQMGFNEVDAALRHYVLGEPAPVLGDNGGGVAIRYWNEVYVPREAFERMQRDGALADPLAKDVRVEDWGVEP
jgi:carbamoyl-phosphate synthase large subunit